MKSPIVPSTPSTLSSQLQSLRLPESQTNIIQSPSELSPRSVDIPVPDASSNKQSPQTTPNSPSSNKWRLDSSVLESVVKLYVTHCEPKYIRPWQMGAQSYTTSSGFVLPNRLILTNAHSVEHYTMVRVKRRTHDKRYTAKVLAIGEECDLALLTVEDDVFWGESTDSNDLDQIKLNPLRIGETPKLRDSVIVAGYPHGGDGMSVTAGVVSRIELLDYTSASTLLSVQIDAAINPGNSGGPAFDSDGNIVGVAFRVMSGDNSENIGYLIPPNVVKHFLNDVKKHGNYTGFCTCGFQWIDLECDAARRLYNLADNESGILVRNIFEYKSKDKTENSDAYTNGVTGENKLMKNDIITHIDNVRISNSGTISHIESGERMLFHVLIAEKFNGENIKLRVFRNGKFLDNINHKLSNVNEFKLIPVHLNNLTSVSKPEYFVFGGLVFISLTGPYLKSAYGTGMLADSRTPINIRWIWEYGYKKYEGEQVVILSHVLNSELNIHYEHLFDERVFKINDTEIINLKHLYDLVTNGDEKFVKLELLEDIIILDRKEALNANQDILKMHHIPNDSSFSVKNDHP